MNTVSLELGLLLLGEPPYPAAKASELLELLASSHEAVCPAADLTRLEHVAGAIASGDSAAALDLASRLESARGDCGCWLRNAARLRAQARKKAEAPFRRRCRIALLGSTTIDFLAPILQAQCFGAGIDAEIYIGPFNQYEQEIRDPDSGLARFRPDVIAIGTDWRSLGLRDEEDSPGEAVRARCARLESLWR